MSAWETILVAVGGNAALLAVLGWLARSLIGQVVAKDLERFKTELASASTAATERLKHEFQLVAQEHQIVVSKLHERRAQVVAESYGLLVDAQLAAQDLLFVVESDVGPSEKEKYSIAKSKEEAFYYYFEKNRIYLPLELCEQLNEFRKGMRSNFSLYGVYTRYSESDLTDSRREHKEKARRSASDYFSSEVPKARAALEAELRSMIGGASKNAS